MKSTEKARENTGTSAGSEHAPACPPRVAALAHRRWTVPLLAQLHQARVSGDSTGARSVGLVRRLGVGRESLRQTVEFAIEHGWVTRNPGHGHPLRPEFVLTQSGRLLAPACDRVWRTAVLVGAVEVLGRKWASPIFRVLADGAARFGACKAALAPRGITDRALSQTLVVLQTSGWIERRVVHGHPPGVEYLPSERARPLVRAVARL